MGSWKNIEIIFCITNEISFTIISLSSSDKCIFILTGLFISLTAGESISSSNKPIINNIISIYFVYFWEFINPSRFTSKIESQRRYESWIQQKLSTSPKIENQSKNNEFHAI